MSLAVSRCFVVDRLAAGAGFVADGIVEGVITELSRFRDLTVIARDSIFSFRGQAFDVRRIAKELACATSSRARRR